MQSTEKYQHLTMKAPITASLSEPLMKEQKTAREALSFIFSSIKYLGQQGFPLQGHEMHDGPIYNLVLERAADFPEICTWLKRRNNWLSNTIENEIVHLMAHEVQREIVTEVKDSHFFAIIADGTTDVCGDEQVSICIQYATQNMEPSTTFVGFYNAPSTTREVLTSVLKDILLRLDLPIEKLQGFAFDGAANMSGWHSGIQARLKEVCTDALHVHCSNHCLDLSLQEVAKTVRLVTDTLSFVREVDKLVRNSSKRKQAFAEKIDDGQPLQLRSLCPTR